MKMEDKTHTCRLCKENKPFADFRIVTLMKKGIDNRCNACISKKNKARYRERLGLMDPEIDITNKYKENTVEHEIYDYFASMKVYLDDERLKLIISELKKAEQEGTYFITLDFFQEQYKAYPYNYESDFPKVLRRARKIEQGLKVKDNKRRKVMQMDMEGNYIATYNSVSDASEAISGSRTRIQGGISNTANGGNRQSGGYIWEFVN